MFVQRNGGFTVSGMTTVGLEILVRVRRFYMQVGLESAVLYVDPCVQKYDFLRRPDGGEFNRCVRDKSLSSP